MLNRRRMMLAGNGFQIDDDLPSGYRKCEYLQGRGKGGYIVIPAIDITNKPSVMLEVEYPNYEYDTSSFGSLLNNVRFEHGIGWDGKAFSYNFGNGYGALGDGMHNAQMADGTVVAAKSIANQRLVVEYKNESIYLNGVEQTIAKKSKYANGVLGVAYDVYIFGTNRGNELRYFKGKIYRFSVEGQINLIPALDQNGVPCMYDKISHIPFYNAGNGKFGYKLMDGTYVAPV